MKRRPTALLLSLSLSLDHAPTNRPAALLLSLSCPPTYLPESGLKTALGVSSGNDALSTGALSPVSMASLITAEPVISSTSQGNTMFVAWWSSQSHTTRLVNHPSAAEAHCDGVAWGGREEWVSGLLTTCTMSPGCSEEVVTGSMSSTGADVPSPPPPGLNRILTHHTTYR